MYKENYCAVRIRYLIDLIIFVGAGIGGTYTLARRDCVVAAATRGMLGGTEGAGWVCDSLGILLRCDGRAHLLGWRRAEAFGIGMGGRWEFIDSPILRWATHSNASSWISSCPESAIAISVCKGRACTRPNKPVSKRQLGQQGVASEWRSLWPWFVVFCAFLRWYLASGGAARASSALPSQLSIRRR